MRLRLIALLRLLWDLPSRLKGSFGRGGSAPSSILNCTLLPLGRHDVFTVGDACEGVCILGGVGSGKTSGSGAAFARAMLSANFGGLVLTAKPGERALWEGYAREAGR